MKPYIICYMMTSIDGRIDCGMTAQLKGVDDYYQILGKLDIPTTVSGRTTAELEMALPGKFEAKNTASYKKEGFSKKTDAPGYEVIVDTRGTLLWEKETSAAKPHLIITSRQASEEYLKYLDRQNISWIVCGQCGELCRRVHWNNHGCKSIVWRCISRLEPSRAAINCTSRTVKEELLQEITVYDDHFTVRFKSGLEVEIDE